MPNQTLVQIAWVTRDLDATEQALSTMLGAKRWVRDTQLELIAPVRGGAFFDYVRQEQQ